MLHEQYTGFYHLLSVSKQKIPLFSYRFVTTSLVKKGHNEYISALQNKMSSLYILEVKSPTSGTGRREGGVRWEPQFEFDWFTRHSVHSVDMVNLNRHMIYY